MPAPVSELTFLRQHLSRDYGLQPVECCARAEAGPAGLTRGLEDQPGAERDAAGITNTLSARDFPSQGIFAWASQLHLRAYHVQCAHRADRQLLGLPLRSDQPKAGYFALDPAAEIKANGMGSDRKCLAPCGQGEEERNPTP